ncbi:MAG: GTP-binding protein, partial [Gammaproteobacteria bacterium]
MIPVIALVGRPNVGKSTLFNTLTQTRDAIVHNQPGLTRDRLYGRIRRNGKTLALLVDTGGLGDESIFGEHIDAQVDQVLKEVDKVIFLLDANDGLAPGDKDIAKKLRKEGVSVVPVVNKAEGVDARVVSAEFQSLGIGNPHAISAKRGDRVNQLLEKILEEFPTNDEDEEHSSRIRVAIVGRPNVGKSTLINALIGEKRVIVMDHPGTTRDSVDVPFKWNNDDYILVDTA